MSSAQKQHRTLAGKLFRLLGLLIVLMSFLSAWLLMDFQAFREAPLDLQDRSTSLIVKPGNSLKSVAAELEQRGLLENRIYLLLLGRWLGLDAHIKAGEYSLQPGTNPEQLLRILAEGKVVQYVITLVEGHTFREVMARIGENPVLEQTLESHDPEEVMRAIGYPEQHPEGRFLPETYHFPRGTTDVQFLRRAYRNMETFLEASWRERDDGLPLQTPYEALILASIVEKETGVEEERTKIAGVFTRRLKTGMRLQTDPTVIYGIGESYDGDIRYRDLRTDTPYNTYTRSGLPPTPIAMPGKDAIRAVMHPADGDELYFVSRGDGSHYFSATLREHNRAVDRYQRNR
ncbi:MAG: endolytic transglycosylase MltG [Thiogranum sp.]|nr:endolytic transglycosylase MltG [Thiogranum sp.]